MSPDSRMVVAASTTVENNGEQSRARPASSSTTESSPKPKPAPPYSSGMAIDWMPSWSAISFHTLVS